MRDLLVARAVVTVVAPRVTDALAVLANEGSLSWRARAFEDNDVDGAWLVLGTSGVAAVDEAVSAAARGRGVLVNCVDRPELCDFYFTAVVRRDPVLVSVTTSGAAPALAARVRRQLEDVLDHELGAAAVHLASWRALARRAGRSTLAERWSERMDDDFFADVAAGRWASARARVMESAR